MRLRNRITPADTFTDGRLLGVSPRARALAIVIESLAEDTGLLVDSPVEIRSAAGAYLSDAEGRLPSTEDLTEALDELAAVSWVIRQEV
ncbi:MAG: hypothetical protein IBX63_10880, partial [Coriobacteriia bacterium]|nr:hypothetical protein [Coriobacteriia bacterium]